MKKVIQASKEAKQRKLIKASKSTADLLEAFEDRLADFGVEACDNVEASTNDEDWRARQEERAVEIDDYDYELDYEDVGGGGFEEVSKDGSPILSLGEIKEYWNKNNINDPVLENYDTFEDWWSDTRSNYLREV